MVSGDGEMVCGVGCGADFAVDFGPVGVGEECVEKCVCGLDGVDGVGSEERRKTFLPVVVAAFDFAFCLGRGGVAEGDAIKVESRSELGERVRRVGEKKGMVIDVESQREAVGEEGAGEKIEVGAEVFGRVDAGAGVQARGVVEDVQKSLFVRVAGEPGMRSGVVLPKRTEVADLPATDRFGGFFVTGVRREVVGDGPAADAGAIGLEGEAAEQFAGDGAVGARRGGTQKTCGQNDGVRRPVWLMIAAGNARLPSPGAALGAGAQVVGAELVNAGQAQAEFRREARCRKFAGSQLGEKVADQRRGKTAGELWFFIAPVVAGGWILRIPAEAGQG